ncbi:HNH endonuclease signature motif containing protein [Flexivirga alba]|uniref:HNH endonuclease signature motif containing protein n=1 Tax=Flexivirga alba TaxID=702742 RepID=A0ABW2ALH3_9MICO
MVDLSGVPAPVADALAILVAEVCQHGGGGAVTRVERVSREHLGDVVQAAEAVKGFAEAALLDATSALVEDVAVDHGVPVDDPRYAAKVAVHRKGACRAVVHEVQLLTGSTLTAARDRVRFATALPARVGGAHELLRAGGCSWERARIAYAETAHLDPVLAGQLIDRLLAPPERTVAEDGSGSVPLSHSGFRARVRRQLALVEGAAADRKRRHEDAMERRDGCTFPGRDGTATFQATGDAARVFAAQQRLTEMAKAARAGGDPRTLAQLRADIAVDLLIGGTVAGHEFLGDAPAGRLQVIVHLASILPEDLVAEYTAGSRGAAAAGGTSSEAAGAGAAFGVGEVPGLGFLSPEQVREVAVRAGSTWARLVTDPVTGEVMDAASTYRVPAGMGRLVKGRDHRCRAPGDCGVSAADCDVDHDTEYRAGATEPVEGATHPDNLHLMHRGHHNAKTGRFWSSQQHSDASITWQTLTRRLRTSVFDHHRPGDQCPPRPSRVEQQFGIRLALCREHDVIPNVFTDLEDLHLLADHDQRHDLDDSRDRDEGQEHDKKGCRQPRGRMQFYPPSRDIRIEFPEPPPPF